MMEGIGGMKVKDNIHINGNNKIHINHNMDHNMNGMGVSMNGIERKLVNEDEDEDEDEGQNMEEIAEIQRLLSSLIEDF